MSKTVVIQKFDGGIAEDVRTTSTNQCASSSNFDTLSYPHKLVHRRDMFSEFSGGESIANTKIAEVGVTTISGTDYIIGVGLNYPTNTLPVIYTRSASTVNAVSGAFASSAVGIASYLYTPNTLTKYNGYSYILGKNGAVINLQKYTGEGTLTNIVTLTYTLPTGITSATSIPKPFVHPSDNRMYISNGNSLAVWDGVSGSFQLVNSLLPIGYETKGITNWGDFLVIAMSPVVNDQNESILCLWDRDYANHSTYLSHKISLGNESVEAVENLNGDIIVVTSSSSGYSISNKLKIKIWNGGNVTSTVVSLDDLVSTTQTDVVYAKKDNKLYFTRPQENSIYLFGKNKEGTYVLTSDYAIYKGTSASSDVVQHVYGISFIGDALFVGATMNDNTFRLLETSFDGLDGSVGAGSPTYINNSVWTTTINPSMPVEDRGVLKRLVSVQVLFDSIDIGTSTLSYAVDGSSTFNTIDAHDMSDGKNIIEATTENGIPFATSREFQFKITSTNRADVLSIRYKYELLTQLV